MRIGRALGQLMYVALRSRRRITLINLRLAFPELSDNEQVELARKAFDHLGMATVETAWLWFRRADGLGPVELHGVEHLESALANGKGVILLQAHFTVLELCAPTIGSRWPSRGVYATPKNPLFADYLLYQRSRHVLSMIDNRGIRDMVRALRRGEIVWYSPDQSVPTSHGGIATHYFNQPALTTTGTDRIVKMTGCSVIPLMPSRESDGSRYTFNFGPPVVFKSTDTVEATQQINDQLEQQVRKQPEQYLWAHKRFKPPTPAYTNPYA